MLKNQGESVRNQGESVENQGKSVRNQGEITPLYVRYRGGSALMLRRGWSMEYWESTAESGAPVGREQLFI